jgi:hypothetical protein
MKIFLLCAILWCSHSALAQSIDTGHYTIIKFDPANHIFPETYKSATLTKAEIDTVEMVLQKCLEAYNRKEMEEYEGWVKKDPNLSKDQFIISPAMLKSLNRQYIAAINDNKEKEVWVNCFPPMMYDDTHQSYEWKKNIVTTYDGGHDYFNLKVNLTQKTFSALVVNGD